MISIALTKSQELVWLGQQLQPGSPLNNMAFALRLSKQVEEWAFQQAFRELVGAVDSMRLRFLAGEPVTQTVIEETNYELPVWGTPEIAAFLGSSEAGDKSLLAKQFLQKKCAEAFDLSGALFDAGLLRMAADEYIFYFNQHHLITDGWGMSLQLNWLLARYNELTGKQGDSPLKELGSFAAYAKRFATEKTTEKVLEQAGDWQATVDRYPAKPLLFGRSNPEYQLTSTRIVKTLSKEQSNALRALCLEPGVRSWSVDLSLFTVFLTALYAYVYRISGQDELVIGAPAHNRHTAVDKTVAGIYIELFPLCVKIDAKETFASLLTKVNAETMSFLRNAKPGSSSTATGRSFNVLFNFINTSFNEAKDPDLDVEWLHPGETETGHLLKLQVYDFANTGQLRICLDVNHAILPESEAELAHQQFTETLNQLVKDRNQLIGLPGATTLEALRSFNHTDASYSKDTTIPQLIAERCAQAGNSIAVVAGKDQLTYQELDEKSNQLAHYLLSQGLEAEELVAICLDRSLEMMIGLLGIMKAGGAYVPIDPMYPQKRIDFLLDDTGARLVVTQNKYQHLFAALAAEGVIVPGQGAVNQQPMTKVGVIISPAQLIYVIYTSGSTGTPKGVMNEHRGPLNRIQFGQRTFQLDASRDVVLQKTTFCFDVSVWELFWPLIEGAKLVMAAAGQQGDPTYLKQVINEQAVTVVHFVPPMLQAFLGSVEKGELPTLKQVFCSGEALKPEHVNAFNTRLPHAELHNLYGPTEAGIEVTHWQAPAGKTDCKLVPIGKPIANAPLYILNEAEELCPVNVPGELYIGGIQVARGYHQRPALSAEKFVDLQLPGAAKAARLYRTGDLCRWLSSGEIEFLGRLDSQVKVRGFRIELGEIENTLAEFPAYRQGVVVVRKDLGAEGQLVAYLSTQQEAHATEVKQFLAERLPAYMVPAYVVFIHELPTLPNGKIDRKALPSPAGVAVMDTKPQGQFEEMVMEAWTEALDLPAVGRETSFFDLGGHSLSGIRLMNRINEDFMLELPAATIFRYPTVAALATHLELTIVKLLEEQDETE